MGSPVGVSSRGFGKWARSSDLDETRCHRLNLMRQSGLTRSGASRGELDRDGSGPQQFRPAASEWCRWHRCSFNLELCEADAGQFLGVPPPSGFGPIFPTALLVVPRVGQPHKPRQNDGRSIVPLRAGEGGGGESGAREALGTTLSSMLGRRPEPPAAAEARRLAAAPSRPGPMHPSSSTPRRAGASAMRPLLLPQLFPTVGGASPTEGAT